VAPQALYLLNNPFVLARTRDLVERLQREYPPIVATRIERLYTLLFGRLPRQEELKIGVAFVGQTPTPVAWEEYCQLLMCSNEFVYVD
jgi:hypothetical protein